jgi:hypothetical protein
VPFETTEMMYEPSEAESLIESLKTIEKSIDMFGEERTALPDVNVKPMSAEE